MKLADLLSKISPDELDDERWNWQDYEVRVETPRDSGRVVSVRWEESTQRLVLEVE